MSRKSSYLPDENWRWREIALSASLPDDFNLALYHIKKQERQRRIRILLLNSIIICTVALVGGYGYICCLAFPVAISLPIVLSNYFAPTELSVRQDLLRLRADMKHEDALYPIAKSRIGALRLKTLFLILIETAIISFFWYLAYSLAEKSNDQEEQIGSLLYTYLFIFLYFPIRIVTAGILGSYGRLPPIQKMPTPLPTDAEAAQIRQQIAQLQQRLEQIDDT